MGVPTMTTEAVRIKLGFAGRQSVYDLVRKGLLTAYVNTGSEWVAVDVEQPDSKTTRKRGWFYESEQVEKYLHRNPFENSEPEKVTYSDELREKVLAAAAYVKQRDGAVVRRRVQEYMCHRHGYKMGDDDFYKQMRQILNDNDVPYAMSYGVNRRRPRSPQNEEPTTEPETVYA